jgi:hypothetical protein
MVLFLLDLKEDKIIYSSSPVLTMVQCIIKCFLERIFSLEITNLFSTNNKVVFYSSQVTNMKTELSFNTQALAVWANMCLLRK